MAAFKITQAETDYDLTAEPCPDCDSTDVAIDATVRPPHAIDVWCTCRNCGNMWLEAHHIEISIRPRGYGVLGDDNL